LRASLTFDRFLTVSYGGSEGGVSVGNERGSMEPRRRGRQRWTNPRGRVSWEASDSTLSEFRRDPKEPHRIAWHDGPDHVYGLWLRHPTFQRTFGRAEKRTGSSLRHRLARSPDSPGASSHPKGGRSWKRLVRMAPRSARIWSS